MKKTLLTLCAVFTLGTASYSQNQVFHLNGSQSWGNVVTLATDNTAGADDARLMLSYRNGSKQWAIGGQNNTTRFSIWEDAGDGNYGTGWGNERFTVLPGGNVGIGTQSPVTSLDVSGNQTLRNYQNVTGAGASIHFTSYGAEHKGPRIRSYLEFAQGDQSVSRLILSSYNNGYKDELTLSNGSVGIGTINPDGAYKLSVNGSIRSKEVKVEAGWADYVFKKGYQLRPLSEVEVYIAKNSHLPDVPTEAEVKKNGVILGETQSLLLKKVEELTLYLIEKDKEVKSQQADLKAQSDKNVELEARLAKLEALLTKSVSKE